MKNKFRLFQSNPVKPLCGVTLLASGLLISGQASAEQWVANSPESIVIAEGATSYRLKYGDTLWAVSQKINLTVDFLANINAVNLSKGEEYHLPVGKQISWSSDAEGNESVEINNQHYKVSDHDKLDPTKPLGFSIVNQVLSKSNNQLFSSVKSAQLKNGVNHLVLNDNVSLERFVSNLTSTISSEDQNVTSKSIDDKLYFLNTYLSASNMVLVESNGQYALIDAGYQEQTTLDNAIRTLSDLGVKKIDFVILTHLHEDHTTFLNTQVHGLADTNKVFANRPLSKVQLGSRKLLDNFEIGKVIMKEPDTRIQGETEVYNNIVKTLESYNIKHEFAKNLQLGDFKLSIYNDYPYEEGLEVNNSNANSLAVLVEKDNYNLLLTGDIEKHDEMRLANDLNQSGNGIIDLAQAGHHGLSTSNSKSYVDAIGNPTAIVQYNENYIDAGGRTNLQNYGDVLYTGAGTIVADVTNTNDGIVVTQNDTAYTRVITNSRNEFSIDNVSSDKNQIFNASTVTQTNVENVSVNHVK